MSEIRNVTHIDNVRLSDDGSSVIILDQSRLPMHTEYIEINKPAEMYDAIFHLKVRGAPAIGIFAAYCMAVIAKKAACNEFPSTYLSDFIVNFVAFGVLES